MRIMLCILAIAFAIQTATASPLGRSKRHAVAKQKIQTYVHKFEVWIDRTSVIAREVLKEIPSGEEYMSYRNKWKNFVEMYETEKPEIQGCLVQLYGLMITLSEIFAPYHNEFAPPEALVVKELFLKHGYNEIQDEMREFMRNLDTDDIQNTANQLTEEEAMEFLGNCE